MLSTATTSGMLAVACRASPVATSNNQSSLRLKVPATHAGQAPSGEYAICQIRRPLKRLMGVTVPFAEIAARWSAFGPTAPAR